MQHILRASGVDIRIQRNFSILDEPHTVINMCIIQLAESSEKCESLPFVFCFVVVVVVFLCLTTGSCYVMN